MVEGVGGTVPSGGKGQQLRWGAERLSTGQAAVVAAGCVGERTLPITSDLILCLALKEQESSTGEGLLLWEPDGD